MLPTNSTLSFPLIIINVTIRQMSLDSCVQIKSIFEIEYPTVTSHQELLHIISTLLQHHPLEIEAIKSYA
jgi:hypothetical protein